MPENLGLLQKHRDWRFVLRDLTAQKRSLQPHAAALMRRLLSPAASAAWCIQTKYPHLMDKPLVRVLLPGVALQECLDSGRWLSFVPLFLGRPGLQMEFTLVGDELAGIDDENGKKVSTKGWSQARLAKEWESPARAAVESAPAARIINGQLSDWLATGSPMPDLCIMFGPGFESHYDTWLTEDALLPLFRAKVPIEAFSYSRMDFLSDVYLLGACNVPQAQPTCVVNPWAPPHEGSKFIGHFAHLLWTVQPPADPDKVAPDEEKIREFLQASRYVHEAFFRSGDKAMEYLGRPVEAENEDDGAPSQILLLPDGFAVDRADGMVLQVTEDRALEPLEPQLYVPQEALDAWPPAEGMERLIWAIRVQREHIAPKVAIDRVAEMAQMLPPGMDLSNLEELSALAQDMGMAPRPTRNETPGSAKFFNAVDKGDFATAQRLVQENPQLLAAQDGEGKTGVMHAYDEGERDAFEAWAKLGIGLDLKDAEGFAVVHDVIRGDDLEALIALQKGGADLNIRSAAGFTPATMCLTYGAHGCLEHLVTSGADITTPNRVGASVARDHKKYRVPAQLGKLIDERVASLPAPAGSTSPRAGGKRGKSRR